MGIAAVIRSARNRGVVRCGVSARPSPSLAELAAEFGLAADPESYTEIDAAAARRLLEAVLRHDLAYGVEIMPEARAARLATRFLAHFGAVGVRFYTNGTFHEGRPATWEPVTEATIDTGVLVFGSSRAGCLWVEDED